MPWYDISTGMKSDRHPFSGYGEDLVKVDASPVTIKTQSPVQLVATPVSQEIQKEESNVSFLGSLTSGAIMAVIIYSAAKTFNVDKQKAVSIATMVGGTTFVTNLAGNWLYDWTKKLVK
jgi:hypothetical protein